MRRLKTILYWDKIHITLLALLMCIFSLIYPILAIIGILFVIRFRKSIHLGAFFAILFLLFMRYVLWSNHQLEETFQGEVIITEVNEKLYQDQLTVKSQNLFFHIYTEKKMYHVGQVLLVHGPTYHYKSQTIPKGFDLNTYYLSQNIKGYMDNPNITIIGEQFNIYQGRQWLITYLETYESKGYLKSLFLGIYELPKETKDIYQSSGLWFLLSFSGMHLYIILMIFKKIMYEMNIRDDHQKVIRIMIYVIILYMQQGSWVIWRLIIIHFLSYLHYEDHLETTKFERVLLGFLILMIFQIHLIYHLGFLITLSILSMLSLFNHRLNRYPPLIKQVITSYFISIIVLFFMSSFHLLMFLWMPFFIIVFIYGLIPLSLMSLWIKPLDGIVYHVFNVYETYASILYEQIKPMILPKVSPLISLICVLGFLGILIFNTLTKKIVIILCMALLFLMPSLEIHLKGGHVIFLDVEQGDSTVFVTPKCVLVIDSYQYVLDYLQSYGIKHIDYLVLTHADIDHTKEANDLITKLDVKTVLINPYDTYDITHDRVIKTKQGDRFTCGNIEIDVLGPIRAYDSRNNQSIVLQFEVFERIFLMTGDIEKEAEADLIKTYGHQLKSDILKVAHHGSDTSSTQAFINMVRPKIAVMSLKSGNRHHFPHQSVIDRLKQNDIIIYQTNLQGSVTYRSVNKREKWGFNLPF